jgi:hypothetical protein
MSDDITKKLLSIVAKQQQIITKLAQRLEPAPQRIEPKHPELHVAQVVLNALPPEVAATLENLIATRDVLDVYFRPGKASQVALNAITKTVQQLLAKGALPFAYKVRAAG